MLVWFCATLVAVPLIHTIVEASWRPVKDPIYGVIFSYKYATELDNDWQANFTTLLDDLEIRHYRIMSYWDLHENDHGIFDFTILDWQMDEAAKRSAQVSLSIGLRQPINARYRHFLTLFCGWFYKYLLLLRGLLAKI